MGKQRKKRVQLALMTAAWVLPLALMAHVFIGLVAYVFIWRGPLPRLNQMRISTIPASQLREGMYFKPLSHRVVFHTAMVPDPNTTFAPAPGNVDGIVFHSAQQFRYASDLAKKGPDEIRVFITGASTAWGSMASGIHSTIGAFLESRLGARFPGKAIKVITAAAGAWTSTQERSWILNRVTEYEPDMIISYSGYGDIVDVCRGRSDLLHRYAWDGLYFFNAIVNYDSFYRGEGAASLDRRSLSAGRFEDGDCPRKTIKNLEIVNSYLATIRVPFVFVLQPIVPGTGKERDESVVRDATVFRDAIAVAARRNHFVFLDHLHLLDQKPEVFWDRCHIGDVGNDLIARSLADQVPWSLIPRLGPRIRAPAREN